MISKFQWNNSKQDRSPYKQLREGIPEKVYARESKEGAYLPIVTKDIQNGTNGNKRFGSIKR